MINDEIGRCFCKAHNREVCHICCYNFEPTNRMAEENAGLIKKRTEIEETAESYAIAKCSLKGMERMHPRPHAEVFKQNQYFCRQHEKELQKFRNEGKGAEVDAAIKKAMEKQMGGQTEMNAMARAFQTQNPGKSTFEFGGEETQKLYEQFAATPDYEKNVRVDLHTCAYCHKVSEEELKFCAKCRKVVYCNRDCQKKAWKAHKKICIPADSDKVISARLTWAQLEALDGQTASGRTLEVRAVLDESVMRQVVQCKDRNGEMKRVAAYTDSRNIPGLKPGAVLRWKNPRFHYFMDGSSGARIEEEDLVNILVK